MLASSIEKSFLIDLLTTNNPLYHDPLTLTLYFQISFLKALNVKHQKDQQQQQLQKLLPTGVPSNVCPAEYLQTFY